LTQTKQVVDPCTPCVRLVTSLAGPPHNIGYSVTVKSEIPETRQKMVFPNWRQK